MEKRDETTDLKEFHSLEVKRASSKRLLSVCSLQSEHGILLLTTQKGRHWQTHGHTHSGKIYLVIEEALFLAECGVLEVRADGLPLSLQQAYHTLLTSANSVSLALYQVYATLKRCGYVVIRRRLIGLSDKLCSVCPLCRSHTPPDLNSSSGIDLLQVLHSSHGFSKTNLPSPNCSVILCSPGDPFPSPQMMFTADQFQGPLVVAVNQLSSTSFYKLTMTTIETLT